MPPPMTQSTFDDITVNFNVYEETSQESMRAAAEEVQSNTQTLGDDIDHDKSSIVNTRER